MKKQTMEERAQQIFDREFELKSSGGAGLTVFVSDSVSLGGILGEQKHAPMVAICPKDCDEDDTYMSFFKNADEVEALIELLREASTKAFGQAASST